MSFKERLTAPSTTDKYWIHTSNGGVNECIEINTKTGSCIPNCVGYAWGRFYEILGKRPKLSKSNAENWYGYTSDGYKRGQTPKLGAVICWSKGKVGVGSDGAGHVAVVEKVYADGSILTSNSGYGSTRFYTKKLSKPYALSGYKFQGFIYNPAVEVTVPTPVSSSSKKTMKVVVKSGVKVRSGAGTDYKQVGSVKYGVTVEVLGSVKDGSDTWYKVGNGYICGKQGSNVYLK